MLGQLHKNQPPNLNLIKLELSKSVTFSFFFDSLLLLGLNELGPRLTFGPYLFYPGRLGSIQPQYLQKAIKFVHSLTVIVVSEHKSDRRREI